MAYNAQYFSNLFARKKVGKQVIPLLVSQVAHETKNFTDHKISDHNNASGIIWINKPYQKGATKGAIVPETVGTNYPQYYAKFDSLNAWADDYIRILKRGSKPIQATSVIDFVGRLKANGYFTDDANKYLAALKRYYNKYKDITGLSTGGILASIAIALILWRVI